VLYCCLYAGFIIGTAASLRVNKYQLNCTELFITFMQGIYNHKLETMFLGYILLQQFKI